MIRPLSMLHKINFNKELCKFYGTYEHPQALQEAVYLMCEQLIQLEEDLKLFIPNLSTKTFKGI